MNSLPRIEALRLRDTILESAPQDINYAIKQIGLRAVLQHDGYHNYFVSMRVASPATPEVIYSYLQPQDYQYVRIEQLGSSNDHLALAA